MDEVSSPARLCSDVGNSRNGDRGCTEPREMTVWCVLPDEHIVQSKVLALLVPRTCTKSHESGSTRWPAEGTHIWVRPTLQPNITI